MSKKHLNSILKEVGLSENEATVYLAGLSLGPSTVLRIARATDIKRTTVYAVIDELKKKGLMSTEAGGFKKLYVAEDPTRLEQILESRKEIFKQNLPEFISLYNLKGEETSIKHYEGLTAIKGIYMGLLNEMKPHDDYLVIANQEKWFNLDKKFFLKYKEERAKRNVKTRLLFQDSEVAREHKKFQKNWSEDVRILPVGTNLNTDLVIMPKKVIIFQLNEPLKAFVIESRDFVQMHTELFEIIWDSLEEKN